MVSAHTLQLSYCQLVLAVADTALISVKRVTFCAIILQRLDAMISTHTVDGVSALQNNGQDMSVPAAALLEEAVTALLLAGHLLADAETGESPVIPEGLQVHTITVCTMCIDTHVTLTMLYTICA
jgi:hypothetical protein